MPILKMSCILCNKEYIGGIFPSRTTKYCSQICMAKSFMKSKRISKCITCNKEFSVKTKKQVGKFCSVSCIRYQGPIESLKRNANRGKWQNCDRKTWLKYLRENYEKNVIKLGVDDCWGWKKRLFNFGYGNVNVGKRKQILAHRASWLVHCGEIPAKLQVLHSCDNPPCTNPKHLFLGTSKDNAQDCIKKNRKNVAEGEKHYNSKLNIEDVKKIRSLSKLGFSQNKLAKMFNVSSSAIQGIVEYTRWKSVVA